MRTVLRSGALVLALAAVAACTAHVDYDGTEYLCPDGVTCPGGYVCLVDRCVRAGGDSDAAPTGDSGGGPDAPAVMIPMVAVPAGDFLMGCDASGDPNCAFDTFPERLVTLAAFVIDATEVTQAAYQSCLGAGACSPPGSGFDPATRGSYPVDSVTWQQAADYCAFAGKRLPTEAEWEKAARGTDGRVYPWGDTAPTCARVNYSACGGATKPAGSHSGDASPYGATELAGNVAEWVGDWYSATYYLGAPDVDPPGPTMGDDRVVRGGSFASTSGAVRALARAHRAPTIMDEQIGFRCAR